jgi:hypothetical protein
LQELNALCDLIVKQLDFHREAGVYGILQKPVEEEIPFGFQDVAFALLIDLFHWHAGGILRL